MLEALFDLFVPLVVQDIINVGIRDHNTVYILQRCGLMVGLGSRWLVCSITAQYFSARAAVGCAHRTKTSSVFPYSDVEFF